MGLLTTLDAIKMSQVACLAFPSANMLILRLKAPKTDWALTSFMDLDGAALGHTARDGIFDFKGARCVLNHGITTAEITRV